MWDKAQKKRLTFALQEALHTSIMAGDVSKDLFLLQTLLIARHLIMFFPFLIMIILMERQVRQVPLPVAMFTGETNLPTSGVITLPQIFILVRCISFGRMELAALTLLHRQ